MAAFAGLSIVLPQSDEIGRRGWTRSGRRLRSVGDHPLPRVEAVVEFATRRDW